MQRTYQIRGKTFAFQTFLVDSNHAGAIPRGRRVRRNILSHDGTETTKRLRADLGKLVYRGETAEDGIVADLDVTSQ